MENQEEVKSGDTNVRVAVRCRPFNTRERAMNETSCIRLTQDQVVLTNPAMAGEDHSFAFDLVFDQNTPQPLVWEKIGVPILDQAFLGYNGTIFAYGQTGSGKTWSMQGAEGDLQGIIPRMNKALFERVTNEKSAKPSVQFLVTASYFEIYNEIIFDLLDPTDRKKKPADQRSGLEIKEHPVLGVYVKGLQEMVVDTPSKMQGLIDQGMSARTVASTQMNADSSRSHSVFTIKVHKKDLDDESKNIFAKVNLVDLAGSERVKSTGATGATLKEGANINKSLSALGNVINALVEAAKGKKGAFVPYRNSKLTRVLQESLGGNSITAMLAALSPAACNFEETLSTLKYANRAKAIKVKAVKNEEASQISRLNDEIKALKEKLLRQAEGGGGGGSGAGVEIQMVDTSALEEKHRQQLKDLEDAMKSTWEDKARISEEHERDRKKLQAEQEAAERELRLQRERNWAILEDKGDLDLTITHVKETVKKDQQLVASVQSWQSALRELTRLEQKLGEQDTVVDVYRSSLQKDSQNLFKTQGNNNKNVHSARTTSPRIPPTVSFDKATLSMWRQLRDKFTATQSEVKKWTILQDEMTAAINSLLAEVQTSHTKWNADDSDPQEDDETTRSFQLVIRLVFQKKEKILSDISTRRSAVMDVTRMASDMADSLSIYEQAIREEEEAVKKEELTIEDISALTQSINNSNENLKVCQQQYMDLQKAPTTSMTSTSIETPQKEETKEEAVNLNQITLSTTTDAKHVRAVPIGGKDCWTGPITTSASTPRSSSSSSSAVTTTTSHTYLEIALKKSRKVTAVSLQGGIVVIPTAPTAPSPITPPSKSGPQSIPASSIRLPSGLTLAECNGDEMVTKDALGDIIDWVALLKKNPPEKFLKRPPVRFLFDLLKFVHTTVPLFPEAMMQKTWEAISESKQTKIDFMNEALEFISVYLDVPLPTNPTSIVTGVDTELTNKFLQYVAIAAYKYKSQGTTSTGTSPSNTTTAVATPVNSTGGSSPRLQLVGSWLTEIRFAWSMDGVNFHNEESSSQPTGLLSVDDVKTIRLKSAPVEAKYLRIYPLKWTGPAAALRFTVHALEDHNVNSTALAKPPRKLSFIAANMIGTEKVIEVLNALKMASSSLISCLEYLHRVDDLRKAKKQEEVRKRMEGLANEKLALEEMLATEKKALTNEKQDLTLALDSTVNQLREAKSLLLQEQNIRLQLETYRDQLENEKSSLQSALQDQIDENSVYKNEILKLQANYEKDRLLIDSLRKQAEEQESIIQNLTVEVEDTNQKRQQLEVDKEDLTSQIVVLTEERDIARGNEEELYETLRERTQDLERLQESYVDMTDRCNDYQDEVSELREQVDSFQAAIKDLNAHHSPAASSLNTPNANGFNRSVQSTRASFDFPGSNGSGGVSNSGVNVSLPTSQPVALSSSQDSNLQADSKSIRSHEVTEQKSVKLAEKKSAIRPAADTKSPPSIPVPSPQLSSPSPYAQEKTAQNSENKAVANKPVVKEIKAKQVPVAVVANGNTPNVSNAPSKTLSKKDPDTSSLDAYDDDFDEFDD